jgi:hypothetical protein
VRPSFIFVMRASGSCGFRIAAFLRPLAIQPPQLGPRRCFDARGLGQPRQKLVIRLPRVTPHDAPQGRIGLERGGVDADRLALDQIRRRQHLQDPCEDRPVRLHVDQPPRARDRRVLRRRFLQPQAQKPAERERVRGAPRDAALRIDPFEVADQQQPEIRAGEQAGATHRRGVEWRALRLDEFIEGVGVEHLIETLVKRVPAGRRQLIRRDPQSRRPRARSASTHGHAAV